MRSKGRCESASAVRPAAFHASGQVGLEPSWRLEQPGLFSAPGGKKTYFLSKSAPRVQYEELVFVSVLPMDWAINQLKQLAMQRWSGPDRA